jgi:hypothetical protein
MVTIRKFSDPNRARMAKAQLEGAGILVYLKNENFSEIMPIYGTPIAEVELQVEETNIKESLEILGPETGNPEEVEKISKGLNKIFLFIAGMFMLGGLLHAWYHGFDLARFKGSATAGVVTGMIGLLIVSLSEQRKKRP